MILVFRIILEWKAAINSLFRDK